ncbi:MAG: hypothetical protein RJQ07_14290 [Pseudomonadales bacterium]
MPSVEEQQAAFTAQSFGPDYRIAVTSWMHDPRFYLDYKGQGEASRWERHVENLIMLQEAGNSAWFVTDSQFIPYTNSVGPDGHYNRRSFESVFEQALAKQLVNSLRVQATLLDRQHLEDPQSRVESPMHSAKIKAARAGYDAVAMFYFEPHISVYVGDTMPEDGDAQFVSLDISKPQSRAGADENTPYSMAYDTHVAIRALNPDVLLYSHIATYTCGRNNEDYSLPSGTIVQRKQRKTFAQCEREIIDQAIDDLDVELKARR